MSIFSFVKKKEVRNPAEPSNGNTTELANLVLNSIEEGVIIVHPSGVVLLANPAAMRMLGVTDTSAILNVQIGSLLRLENGEGMKLEDSVNPVLLAINSGEKYSTRDFVLVNLIEQRKPVAISVVSTNSGQNERIITLRDISRELEEEGEQTEFISTASHEMRTPVASIEGYLGLALNPKTATIDERARKYLEEAHTSSKHLGRLFKDLLDVTKLDDKKIRVQLSPVEMTSTVRSIANGQVPQMSEKGIHYTFGSNGTSTSGNGRFLNQEVYASVDIDFLREAVNNLVENAIKYTAEGGGIWVNVRGDDDRVLINVTDTGIGISPDDLKHVFQKFYRADNSQTRTVGGTGLGLYLVKQRVEAMGGKVWAESSFGEGSTFYLSFPRITAEEYQRRKQIASNIEAMSTQKQVTPTVPPAETQESQNPIAASPADTPVAPTTTNVSETVDAPVNPVVPVTPNTFTATVTPAVSAAPVTTATPVVSATPAASAAPAMPAATITPVISVAQSSSIDSAQQSTITPTPQPVAIPTVQSSVVTAQQPIAIPTVQPDVIAAQQTPATTMQRPVTNSEQQFITTPAQQPVNNIQQNIDTQPVINSQPVAPQTPQNLSQTTPPSVNNFNQVPPLNN
jgi:two-component sensor kinase, probably involved in phosphate sensing